MNLSIGQRVMVLSVAASMALAVPSVALAQSTGKSGGLKRTPDGQPDISGMYEPGHISQPAENPIGERWKPKPLPGGRTIGPTDFGAKDAADSDPGRPQIKPSNKPFVIDPPDGKIPMQPWVAERRKVIYDNQDKAEHLDPRVRCLQAGVPRAHTPVYYNSYQILQRPGAVVIVYEWNHMTRIIPLDNRPHLDKRIKLPMGDSRGRWEGDELVVVTTNFNDDTWVLGHGGIGDGQPASSATTGHGIVHSDELKVTERFIPIDGGNIIRYRALIEDPKAFTRPFTIEFDAMVRGRADHQIFEYACHEGNRDGILMATGVDIDPSQK